MPRERTTLPRPPRQRGVAGEPAKSAPPSSADESRRIALLAARAGLEKKATAVEIIDVIGKVDYADFLVLMTGASDRNVAAIAQAVDAELAGDGVHALSIEGLPAANWVLIDFVDVVVHVFQRDVRSLYDLDGLWMDADRVPVAGGAPGAEAAPEFAPRKTARSAATPRTAAKARLSAGRRTVSKPKTSSSAGGAAKKVRASTAARSTTKKPKRSGKAQ